MVFFEFVAHYDGFYKMYLKHTNSFPAVKTHPYNMNIFLQTNRERTPKLQECECFSDIVHCDGCGGERPILPL